jgi:outer membrane protein OmpA-like peptidoglycan-associated protein
MLTLFASPVAGLAPVGLFKATPGVDRPDETIDGFPEFTQDVDLIKDPTIKPRLRALAKKIVASHNGGGPRIIGFEVHGHADATLRIANRAEADRTENELSQERADNAKDLLLQLIEEEGGKPIILGIRANATAKGFGSKHRIFVPAHNEQQMKKNRRVEIFLRQLVTPPPRPTPPPEPTPPPPPVEGSHWRIQILDGFTTTIAIPETELNSFNIVLSVDVIDIDRKQKARFSVKATGTALPGATVGPPNPVQTSPVTKGEPSNFTIPRGANLGLFAGSVDVSQDPGASVSVLSSGGHFNFSFTEMEKSGFFPRPTVVSVSAGSGALSLPQGSLGGVATGTMTMRDAPAPAP